LYFNTCNADFGSKSKQSMSSHFLYIISCMHSPAFRFSCQGCEECCTCSVWI
jgi:hypothetical protein